MAEENRNIETSVDTSTPTSAEGNTKGSRRPWWKDKKNKKSGNPGGFRFKELESGLQKGFSVDGSISVPNTGNQIISRKVVRKEGLINNVESTSGFMIVDYLPIFGSDSRQKTWASLTKQGDNLWRTIRSATPHAETYQAGDVMAAIVIAAGLRYGLAEVKRMMQSATWFSEDNQYVQHGIWRGLTNDLGQSTTLSSLQNLLVGWKNQYNGIINTLSAVPFPDIFPIFHRWEYMSSTIFRDADDESQAQYILFKASHLYDFEYRPESDPGINLVPVSISGSVQTLLDKIENIASRVTSDSDMSDLFADIVLAYPSAQTLKWSYLTDSDITVGNKMSSVYDLDTLWALHNAQITEINAPTWHVVPETGSILGFINAPYGKGALGFHRPIMATNFDTMDISRFLKLTQWVVYDADADYSETSQGIDLINVPTEILTAVQTFWFKWDIDNGTRTLVGSSKFRNGNCALSNNAWDNNSVMTIPAFQVRQRMTAVSFAYFPLLRQSWAHISTTPDAATPDNILSETLLGQWAEIEKPFLVNEDQLIQAHDIARVGLWNIPTVLLNGKKNGSR